MDTGVDGSAVAAQENLILRYRPNGWIDRGFGENGRLTIPSVEGLPFGLADVAIDDEGRVLVFGTVVDPNVTREIPGYYPIRLNPSYLVVMRFDRSGRLDPTFGGGDGIFRHGLGLRPLTSELAEIPLVGAEAAELDSAGRPVVAVAEIGIPPSLGHSHYGWVTDTLIRLIPSGELDASFGGGDGIAADLIGPNGSYSDFCISAGDLPVIASWPRPSFGFELNGTQPTGALTRLDASGAPDPSFGDGGHAYVRGGSGELACDRTGGLAVLQPELPPEGEAVRRRVVRLSADGRIQRRFGRNGRTTVKLPGTESELASLRFDPRGRALLSGTLRQGLGREQRAFFTVIRLLSSGKPDRSFGHGGWVRTGFGRHTIVTAAEAALDGRGRLLVGGSGSSPQLQPGGVVLARYVLGR